MPCDPNVPSQELNKLNSSRAFASPITHPSLSNPRENMKNIEPMFWNLSYLRCLQLTCGIDITATVQVRETITHETRLNWATQTAGSCTSHFYLLNKSPTFQRITTTNWRTYLLVTAVINILWLELILKRKISWGLFWNKNWTKIEASMVYK